MEQGRIGSMVSFRSLRGVLAGFLCAVGLAGLVLVPPAAAERMIPGVTAQLMTADIHVDEGEDAVFTFRLSRSFDFSIRYAYRTQDVTARAGKDYAAQQGHVVFPAGRQTAEVRVPTFTDNHIDNEVFQLELSDTETHGHGMVWGQYVWTDWWRIDGLPQTKTVRARIHNSMPADAGRR